LFSKLSLIAVLAILIFFPFTIALAQDNAEEASFLSNLVPILFVIVFILLLLGIAGVISFKRPGVGRIPWGKIIFLVAIIGVFVVAYFAPYPTWIEVPESFKVKRLPEGAVTVFAYFGLPDEWMYVPAIIYLFILPFAGIYTIVWAFLTSLDIFSFYKGGQQYNKIYRLLAFIITFLTLPTGLFVKLVWIMFGFMGALSVAIFALTFIVGIFFRGYGVTVAQYTQAELQKIQYLAYAAKQEFETFSRQIDRLPLPDAKSHLKKLWNKYKSLKAVKEVIPDTDTIDNYTKKEDLKNAVNNIIANLK